ncbi:gliding motility lipoprotein GldD [Sphingobacterium hotanense]|uniref:Gliding motility lipoprotein GldD n=1 Tax=Sphingobacterium hotanense TaxID=649196 RepID=A0ABT7NKU2_9SPHI|nr:gliding motility lipoprotein GldD [Sphingobacterium hotanense]MCT1523640.1 gliding motility lipoprotein GldD [Sphingobacterium hotanense]MDM1047876.1 gliding motility lipoprotein GldD [Sphingobacterium hotanense]
MRYVFAIIVLLAIVGCQQQDYSPKPRGFFRIDFPTKSYQEAQTGCPFILEIPSYSQMLDDPNEDAKECWKNLYFPQFNATLHLSYFPINKSTSFQQLTEDARTFAFKHTTKATAIDQSRISIPEHEVYGIQYLIGGNTASNYQFFVSDSTEHYLRGALYFNEKPHLDSIQPVLEFIKSDIKHLIHSVKWK